MNTVTLEVRSLADTLADVATAMETTISVESMDVAGSVMVGLQSVAYIESTIG